MNKENKMNRKKGLQEAYTKENVEQEQKILDAFGAKVYWNDTEKIVLVDGIVLPYNNFFNRLIHAYQQMKDDELLEKWNLK